MANKKESKVFGYLFSIYIGLLLGPFLFIVGGKGYQKIFVIKYMLFLFICGGFVLISAILFIEKCLIEERCALTVRKLISESCWLQKLVVLYMGITWISALCSQHWPKTVVGLSRYEGALTITIYSLIFLMTSKFGKLSARNLWLLGISISIFNILCLIQLMGYNPFGLYPEGLGFDNGETAYSVAYIGTIGNIDLVACFYSLTIPMMIYAMIQFKEKVRFLLLIPLLSSLVVLISINVMAGYLGVGFGSVLSFPFICIKRRRNQVCFFILLAVFFVMAILIVYCIDFKITLFHELHEILHGNLNSNFGSGRIHIWSEVCKKLPGHIILGNGPDTMIYGGMKGLSRYDDELGRMIVAEIDIAHNEYLNILYHQGIFALAVYILFFLLLAKQWIKIAPTDEKTAILGAGIIGYCIQAFFGFSTCLTAPFFWTSLGLIAGAMKNKEKEN